MTAALTDLRELTRPLSAFAAFQLGHFLCVSAAQLYQGGRRAGLADLSDAGHFHDRRFLLTLCKASGLIMIRVGASKSFAVVIENFSLPVMVFSPLVFPE